MSKDVDQSIHSPIPLILRSLNKQSSLLGVDLAALHSSITQKVSNALRASVQELEGLELEMSHKSKQEIEIEDEGGEGADPSSFMSPDKAHDGFYKGALDKRAFIVQDSSYKKGRI